jgi:MFS family permease
VLILGLIAVAIGAAVLTPASLAIVTDSFRGERRGMAVGACRLFERLGPVPPIVGGMVLAGVAMLLLGGISTSTGYADCGRRWRCRG